jgi:hypothetical protein
VIEFSEFKERVECITEDHQTDMYGDKGKPRLLAKIQNLVEKMNNWDDGRKWMNPIVIWNAGNRNFAAYIRCRKIIYYLYPKIINPFYIKSSSFEESTDSFSISIPLQVLWFLCYYSFSWVFGVIVSIINFVLFVVRRNKILWRKPSYKEFLAMRIHTRLYWALFFSAA